MCKDRVGLNCPKCSKPFLIDLKFKGSSTKVQCPFCHSHFDYDSTKTFTWPVYTLTKESQPSLTLPPSISPTQNPLDIQVGGSHYKKYKIQPAEYNHANGLDWFQGNIVKYITRFRDKNGKEDLEKIIHYAQMLIELEYPS